jgi:protein O-GlcNAc transferase
MIHESPMCTPRKHGAFQAEQPAPASSSGLRVPFDACPLCGGEDAEEIGVASCATHPLYRPELPPTLRWIRCDGCGHVFVDGYFSEHALSLVFGNAHPSQLPGPDTLHGRAAAAKIVEDVSNARSGGGGAGWGGRWLEVGFGNGALLTTAAEFGYQVVGLDLRSESVQRMRALGFDARRADLMTCDERAGFDVISMADVLEHMPFPKVALTHARQLLRPGGALFVSMPNMDSFAWQELERQQRNPYWGELEHFHNFGRARLHALLRETGFEPCRYGISQRYIACMEIVARPVE